MSRLLYDDNFVLTARKVGATQSYSIYTLGSTVGVGRLLDACMEGPGQKCNWHMFRDARDRPGRGICMRQGTCTIAGLALWRIGGMQMYDAQNIPYENMFYLRGCHCSANASNLVPGDVPCWAASSNSSFLDKRAPVDVNP